MNSRRIAANFNANIRGFYRNKATVFFVVLFPILLMLLFGMIFQDTGENMGPLYIQDMDGGVHSEALINALNSSGVFDVKLVEPGTDADSYITAHHVNTFIVIPEGFSDSVNMRFLNRSLPAANITILYDPGNSAAQQKIGVITQIINGMNMAYSGSQPFVGIDAVPSVSDDYKYIDFFAPGIIAMSVMTSSLFGTVGMNIELRQKGILRKLATTPITRSEWLVSNILYQFIMAMISFTAIILVGVVIFGLKPHLNGYLFLFIILEVFAFSGIGMLITRFVRDADGAQAAANAIMFPMMFLSGTFFPVEMMPDLLQKVARLLPLYYVNEGLRSAMVDMNLNTIIESAVVIGVFGVVVFILGVLLTSWKED